MACDHCNIYTFTWFQLVHKKMQMFLCHGISPLRTVVTHCFSRFRFATYTTQRPTTFSNRQQPVDRNAAHQIFRNRAVAQSAHPIAEDAHPGRILPHRGQPWAPLHPCRAASQAAGQTATFVLLDYIWSYCTHRQAPLRPCRALRRQRPAPPTIARDPQGTQTSPPKNV